MGQNAALISRLCWLCCVNLWCTRSQYKQIRPIFAWTR